MEIIKALFNPYNYSALCFAWMITTMVQSTDAVDRWCDDGASKQKTWFDATGCRMEEGRENSEEQREETG